MPRRQFVADLQKAQTDILPHGISDLQPGGDDGQLEFHYSRTASLVDFVRVTALVPELSDYPKSHDYMIFSGEDAPRHIAEALQDLRRTRGKTVLELLDIVSTSLAAKLKDGVDDELMQDSQLEDDDEALDQSEDEDDAIYDSDHDAFDTDAPKTTPFAEPAPGFQVQPADRAFRARIRSDLITARNAGFKVGVLGHILDGYNAFVTLAIRMGKLGLSDEAMEAWQITSADYLILILQYPNGYKTNEQLQGYDSIRIQPNIGMRVVSGKNYKPTLQEAIKAFTVAKKEGADTIGSNELPNAEDCTNKSSIKDTFISKPLNGLLQERLVVLLRFRGAGMTWSGAEDHYSTQAAAGASYNEAVPDNCFRPEPINPALPDMMNADHYSDRGRITWSFPLLAMQFLLRHFVRCTEFCLVCHRRMSTQLEAIKPYVCDSELCLYQYMTLGFGPSIEHEILTQPYVVDLLVSFCYKSAATAKLKEFPDGLSLMVPGLDEAVYTSLNVNEVVSRYAYNQPKQPADPYVESRPSMRYEVGFDRDRLEIIFFNQPPSCPVRRGDWIVLKTADSMAAEAAELHCRVAEVTFFPTITVNAPVVLKAVNTKDQLPPALSKLKDKPAPAKPVSPASTPKWIPATFQVYCEDFKSLAKRDKCLTICRLLDTIPDVKAMQEYLAMGGHPDLKSWVDRISPAALSLLRWIIASNRACIVQVDGNGDTASKQERLYGMKDYMQFRFAMGAPDKEQRFLTEVRKTSDRLNLAHPTIFAWHGSPLYNWHMIIREGLHFKNVDHGRAFGDGVYHALDASTSTSYSGMAAYGAQGTFVLDGWRSSVLRVNTALALNEIVNAPAEFQSQSPYYVVPQLDWIQTRYLFVRCTPTVESIRLDQDVMPQNALHQDPKRVPRGATATGIVIPASAIKTHRIIQEERKPKSLPTDKPSPFKKLKMLGGFGNPIPLDDDDDAQSVASNASDHEILFGTDAELELTPVKAVVPITKKPTGPPTDFVQGTLDFTKLPLMPTPLYAVSNTTTRLMRDLAACNKIQTATPPAELGWYIDVSQIENPYQWILELHSFHMFTVNGKPLPLATDMQKKNLKSVVMEVRFNKDFPFTPPYVRVIRPRFLSLAQGGGGHIVLGGAMCMELLTNTGWSSVSSMESVLLQIRVAIASEPFARLDMRGSGDYGTAEAADGYVRACQTHGWQVPPGFREMAYGVGAGGAGRA